jgi:MFS family permease
VLAKSIAADAGWPLSIVVGGLSLGLIVSALISPRVGRAIQARGGRSVLAASSVLIGAGLATMGFAPSVPFYLAAWLVVGAGMASGLYEAGFGTLGRLYGQGARPAIVALTLFGGFASTICWPISTALLNQLGWRGVCLVYAGVHLAAALPLHLVALPRPLRAADPAAGGRPAQPARLTRAERTPFLLLATQMTIAGSTASIVAVHLLNILQARGLDVATAVALGALVGPSQVGARVVEMAFGRHYHPLWTMLASSLLVTVGLCLLFTDAALPALALILYGAGIGIHSIARGTVPLALFGPASYAALVGRLALPSLLVQAVSPILAAVVIADGGASLTLAGLAAMAALNVGVSGILWGRWRGGATA